MGKCLLKSLRESDYSSAPVLYPVLNVTVMYAVHYDIVITFTGDFEVSNRGISILHTE